MPRPIRLGKRKVSQSEFDAEVKRLQTEFGLSQSEIAKRLGVTRWTIGRSMKRVPLTSTETVEKKWLALTNDEFYALPEIQDWIRSLLRRKVSNWKSYPNTVKRCCDQLQIHPAMFDLAWGQKWLDSQGEKSKAQLRQPIGFCRAWFKFHFHTQDHELTEAGFDAKHYEVGKWSHVRLSAEQWGALDEFLGKVAHGMIASAPSKIGLKAWFVVNFCKDTCARRGEVGAMRPEYFSDQGGLITVRIPGESGEAAKSGNYESGWVRRFTYTLALAALPISTGEMEEVSQLMKEAYRAVGLTVPYFFTHAIHALRHCGGQRWLELTNYNRAAVCRIGHGHAEITLEKHYGAIPDETVLRLFGEANKADESVMKEFADGGEWTL